MSEATMSLLSNLSSAVNVDVDLGFKLPHEEEVKKPPPMQQSVAEIHQQFAPPPVAAAQVAQVEQKVAEVQAPVQEAQQDAQKDAQPDALPAVQNDAAQVAPQPQAPAAPEVAAPPQVAPSPDANQVAPQQAAPHKEVRSPSGAEHWNAAHPALVAEFDQLTGGACRNPFGELDLVWVADWQGSHGCDPDSSIGPKTLAAARKAAKGAPEPEPDVKQAAHDQAGPQPIAPKSNPELVATLTAQYGSLLKQYMAGTLDKTAVIGALVAYDKGLNGGVQSLEGVTMVQALMHDLKDVQPAPHAAANEVAPTQAGPIDAAKTAPQAQQAPQPQAPAPQQQHAAHQNAALFKKVYDGGSEEAGFQKCQVFASAGDITETPDIFLFFHGHSAQYGIDAAQKGKSGSLSGIDVAEQAVSQAKGKNVIAILPQGVAAGSIKNDHSKDRHTHEGGYMKALQAGLPTFLSSVLDAVAVDLNMPKLSPGHISIAGHSAGGYQGVHDALKGAGDLLDHISDITLMDSSYSDAHFKDAAKWMFQGQPGKSLRIIGSPDQIDSGMHSGTFSKSAINSHAKQAGYEVEHLSTKGDDRDNHTSVHQHSQLKKDGAVHGDILILKSARSHGQIRDDVMDDAILSIGQGAAGNEKFAKHDIKHHVPDPETEKKVEQQPQDDELQQDAHAPVQNITVEDLDQQVQQVAPAPPPKAAADEKKQDAVQPEPEDGLVQQHLQQNVGQLEGDGGSQMDEAHKAWLKNTKDGTSVFSEHLKELYDTCVAKAKAGTLCFPAKDEPKGKSSAPFKKFLKALYEEFGYHERRINMDITDHGGKKAYDIRGFLESQLVDVPGQKAQLHSKASASFVEMHEAAAKDGVDLTILSSYRVPKNKQSDNPYAVASNSSHSYGLAMDLKLSVDKDHTADGEAFKVSEITTGDANNLMKYYKSSVTKWMLMNGAKFNFYPYMNEPWHYEYNPEGMAKEIIDGAKAWKKHK
jgi:hypothetical protein